MILIEEIANYLVNLGMGTMGSSIFLGHLPPSPDNAITVLDTGGVEPDRELPIDNPTFQVIVRNTDYETGYNNLLAIKEALHKKANWQIYENGKYYYYIFALSNGGHIGRDDNGRDEFSINFIGKVR